MTDEEKLEAVARWHSGESRRLRSIKHRAPWTKSRDYGLADFHDDTASFLSRLASDLRLQQLGLGICR